MVFLFEMYKKLNSPRQLLLFSTFISNFMSMKKLLILVLILAFLIGCNASKNTATNSKESANSEKSDTLKIANEELEYEVIIIEPGFNGWLASTARPRGYYSESYLESRNQLYVQEWNSRVMQPSRYDPNLYEMRIDYDRQTRYGYEVNYLLYHYFMYFQSRYKQRL